MWIQVCQNLCFWCEEITPLHVADYVLPGWSRKTLWWKLGHTGNDAMCSVMAVHLASVCSNTCFNSEILVAFCGWKSKFSWLDFSTTQSEYRCLWKKNKKHIQINADEKPLALSTGFVRMVKSWQNCKKIIVRYCKLWMGPLHFCF